MVSKGRARRGKVFRMRSLAVGGELRCQELAAEVLGWSPTGGIGSGGWDKVQASAGS